MAAVLLLPLRLACGLLRVLRLTGRSLRGSRLIPVAGIDEVRAQEVLAVLKQHGKQGEMCASRWLLALQLSQITADRLYLSRKELQRHVRFWRLRLSSGRQRVFLLLSQGPLHFVRQVAALIKRAGHHTSSTATTSIDAKLLALSAIDAALLQALALVSKAAGELVVVTGEWEGVQPGVGTRPSGLEASVKLLRAMDRRARAGAQAIVQALEGVRQTLQALTQAEEDPTQQAMPRVMPLSLQPLSPLPDDIGVDAALAIAQHTVLDAGVPPSRCSAKPTSSPTDKRAAKQLLTDTLEQLQGLPEAAWRAWQQAVIIDTQQLLGCCDTLTASEALSRAAVVAEAQPMVMTLPPWTRAPSRYQQNWIRYLTAAGVAAWAAIFLFRHSPLSGSDDLQRWITNAGNAVTTAVRENVEKPLLALQAEFFKTFRNRASTVNRDEYNTERRALVRMLQDFERDKGGQPMVAPSIGDITNVSIGDAEQPAATEVDQNDIVSSGMQFLMRSYEQQLVHPLRNLLTGDLARSLLIQIQKVKVDSEGAMLEMDQILRANELSISLIAAVPALLIAYTALMGLFRLLTPSAPDPVWEALPARLAMVDLERSIGILLMEQQGQAVPVGAFQQHLVAQSQQQRQEKGLNGEPATGAVMPAAGVTLKEGEFVHNLAVVFERCRALFLKHSVTGSRSEWPQLRRDLLDLAGPSPAEHKRDLALMIMRSYTIFQQFNRSA